MDRNEDNIENAINDDFIFFELLFSSATLNALSLSNQTICPCISAVSHSKYVDELSNCQYDIHICKVRPMQILTFDVLISRFSDGKLLNISKNVFVQEQFFTFLMTISQGLSNCAIYKHFQHSGATLSK
jgi:hypothetical protein